MPKVLAKPQLGAKNPWNVSAVTGSPFTPRGSSQTGHCVRDGAASAWQHSLRVVPLASAPQQTRCQGQMPTPWGPRPSGEGAWQHGQGMARDRGPSQET